MLKQTYSQQGGFKLGPVFGGGANIIDKVPSYLAKYGNDINEYLIAMLQAVQNGWQPPSNISETDYQNIRHHPQNYSKALVGFVGIGCSYSGKWWGGYARGKSNRGFERNYCLESKTNLLSQNLTNITFTSGTYIDMYIPENSIIYCDPPYAGTTKYTTGTFDHVKFWSWCESKVDEGHKVFVSEYTAPEHWRCVWSKEVNNTLVKDTGSKRGVEKLFTLTKETRV